LNNTTRASSNAADIRNIAHRGQTMTFRLDVRQASQVLVTADNRGPQINIIAWTATVVMILSVGTRLAIKYNAFRSFGWDDGFVTVAMVRASWIPPEI